MAPISTRYQGSPISAESNETINHDSISGKLPVSCTESAVGTLNYVTHRTRLTKSRISAKLAASRRLYRILFAKWLVNQTNGGLAPVIHNLIYSQLFILRISKQNRRENTGLSKNLKKFKRWKRNLQFYKGQELCETSSKSEGSGFKIVTSRSVYLLDSIS